MEIYTFVNAIKGLMKEAFIVLMVYVMAFAAFVFWALSVTPSKAEEFISPAPRYIQVELSEYERLLNLEYNNYRCKVALTKNRKLLRGMRKRFY